jgi:uncharacterized DUF497 family protein
MTGGGEWRRSSDCPAFDPAKDAINRANHGVSSILAEVLFAGPYASATDDRFDRGELRTIAHGPIEGRLLMCVFVDRDAEQRVMSPGKDNKREVMRHGKAVA